MEIDDSTNLGEPSCISVVLQPIRRKGAREFIRAIADGSSTSVRSCLKAGQHPDTHYFTGFTALSYAAYLGNTSVVHMLLKGSADPNLKGSEGSAPLHHAAARCHAHVLRLLMLHGATPDCQDHRGVTPSQLAAEQGFRSGLVTLRDAGASFTHLDKDGDSPYTMANNVMTCSLVMDAANFQCSWFSVMMRHSYSFSELLVRRGAPVELTYSSLLRRMSCSPCLDALGGSSEPCLGKAPERWVALCHRRASLIEQKQSCCGKRPRKQHCLPEACRPNRQRFTSRPEKQPCKDGAE